MTCLMQEWCETFIGRFQTISPISQKRYVAVLATLYSFRTMLFTAKTIPGTILICVCVYVCVFVCVGKCAEIESSGV